MQKIVKKWGDSLLIHLDPEDRKIYGLEEGDIVEVEIKKINNQLINKEKEINNRINNPQGSKEESYRKPA